MKNVIKLIKMFKISVSKFGILTGFQILLIALRGILPIILKNNNYYYFLNYRINSPNPRLLLALINEIFITDEYLPAVNNINCDIPVIIDCGSNIGISLFYWMSKFPNPNIIAIEPMPEFNSYLNFNVTQNRINAKIENVALGETKDQVIFYTDNKNLTTGSTLKHRGGEEKIIVFQRKLSNYFNSFDKIDLVKMDIEGAESSVLKELICANVLNKPDSYVIEFHLEVRNEESHIKLAQVISKFAEFGYMFTMKSEKMTFEGFQDVLLYFRKM